MTAISEDFFL